MTAWTQQIDNNVVAPSDIAGLANGSDALRSVLRPIYDHTGAQVGLAAPIAARSYNAMVTAAWADGIVLAPSSSADTFRPLAVQQRIFRERYTTHNTGVKGRTCGGVYYWKVDSHVATAACPGTSNHGKGGAIDFNLDHPGALGWLEAHAKQYGWQWELSTEPWHLHYMLGDRLTQTVLDHEAHTPTTPKDTDMLLIHVTDGPDADKVMLVNGDCRRYIDTKPELDQLSALLGPPRPLGKEGWQNIVDLTALDAVGLRSIPPAQYAKLVADVTTAVLDPLMKEDGALSQWIQTVGNQARHIQAEVDYIVEKAGYPPFPS